MYAVYRIYERTEEGMKVIAEVRAGMVTGSSAASIRKILAEYGFPYTPIEDIIDQFLLANRGMGAAIYSPIDGLRDAE